MVPSFIAALYNSTSNDRTITAAGEMGLLMHLHENTKKHAECEKNTDSAYELNIASVICYRWVNKGQK